MAKREQAGLVIDGLALTGPDSGFWALKKTLST